jgi:hypothetical protein
LVSDYLSLHLTEEIQSFVIYNQLGQIVFKLKNSSKSTLKIAINSYAKGIYYLKIDGFKPLKFVKI